MDHVVGLLEAAGEIEDGAREEDEALGVVAVGLGPAVERGAVEVGRMAHQVHRHVRAAVAAGEARLPDRRPARTGADGHVELPARRFDRAVTAVERLAVGRQHDCDVAAEARQGRRQRAEDVGQAAGLRQRGHFARHLEDAHRRMPSGHPTLHRRPAAHRGDRHTRF